MRVFISWSGDRSKRVAEALKLLLKDVIFADAWVSSQNVPKGSVWFGKLSGMISQSDFGILCLTKGNTASPWVAFEAGALFKALGEDHVCPFLIDPEIDLEQPFSLLQSVGSSRDDILKLVCDINGANSAHGVSSDDLNRRFKKSWPDFRDTLKTVREKEEEPTTTERLLQRLSLQDSKIEALQNLFQDIVTQIRVDRTKGRKG